MTNIHDLARQRPEPHPEQRPGETTGNRPLRICVLPGDGIGSEVTAAATPVFEAAGVPVDLSYGEIGWKCWVAEGDTVPPETWAKIAATDVTLLGAITSKPLKEAEAALPAHLRGHDRPFVSPVIQLRQRLNLFANVRPVTDIHEGGRFAFTVIRENTEGLYAGLDFGAIPAEFEPLLRAREAAGAPWGTVDRQDATMAVRLQTRAGLERILRFAFDHARHNAFGPESLGKVTWADKPNVLRRSGAFAREVMEGVARDYPDIEWTIENIDAIALWMVRRPERFGVIVAENMFGDILSDLGAGIMGGLGFAPSANIGRDGAYFEPVHGSAPAHAGHNRANPGAMFLTIALLLDHTGHASAAAGIRDAVMKVARSRLRTYDQGGDATTSQVADAIIAHVAQRRDAFAGERTETRAPARARVPS
ncbi:isocitrate/isopropylmalate family dehydrogenase [Breoghania sp. JC706]|uniref:isocitrate/isopropylmalate dehydrogenase family protein n=1 Tax=Breoghania sp. JC706 TaxID=3117732 RepID=UPI00300ABB15